MATPAAGAIAEMAIEANKQQDLLVAHLPAAHADGQVHARALARADARPPFARHDLLVEQDDGVVLDASRPRVGRDDLGERHARRQLEHRALALAQKVRPDDHVHR
jgi:hypothetical protein